MLAHIKSHMCTRTFLSKLQQQSFSWTLRTAAALIACLCIPGFVLAQDLDSRISKLETAAAGAQSSADNAWVLACSALVLLMTIPGLALFYGGLVRQKNVL